MGKVKDFYFWPIIIEFVVVFLLISLGLLIESFHRSMLVSDKSFNLEIFYYILRETALVSFTFVISFNFIKRSYYSIARRISLGIGYNEPTTVLVILSEIYLICASLLVTMNIRPIIHTTYIESNISNFTYDFVRYDALFSFFTLLVLAIPLTYLTHKHDSNLKKTKIAGIIIILILVSIINSTKNFNARILESSANWAQKNWTKQSIKASEALSESQTNEEKAISYFWLGVSENRQGNFEKAVEYQLNAISLLPNYAAAYSSLSNAYSMLGKNVEALDSAKRCIKYDPTYAWCYNSMMNYFLSINDKNNAIINAKKATNLDPANKELRENYSILLESNEI